MISRLNFTGDFEFFISQNNLNFIDIIENLDRSKNLIIVTYNIFTKTNLILERLKLLENFEEIYNSTYERTLRYIVCKCSNIDDVNDLVQDTYVELYNILEKKKEIYLENCPNFVIGIAKKKIQKYYGLLYKLKNYNVYQAEDEEIDLPDNFDLETETIKKLNAEAVWNYIKSKNIKTVKVFYLYYCTEIKISQIAKELNMSESNVKNILYRTIKDIKENVKIEGDINE